MDSALPLHSSNIDKTFLATADSATGRAPPFLQHQAQCSRTLHCTASRTVLNTVPGVFQVEVVLIGLDIHSRSQELHHLGDSYSYQERNGPLTTASTVHKPFKIHIDTPPSGWEHSYLWKFKGQRWTQVRLCFGWEPAQLCVVGRVPSANTSFGLCGAGGTEILEPS